MKQARGSIFKSVVRGIKSDKTGMYGNLISDEAKKILSKRVLSSSWYPFHIYKECLNAVASLGVKNNMDLVKQWGVDYFDELLPTIYKEGIQGEDIKKSMDKYKRFLKMVYNFGEVLAEYPSDNELIITYKDFDADFEVLYHILRGLTEKYIELSVGNKTDSIYMEKSWEGENSTTIKFQW
ncbi:MAG: hypothetical protein ACFFAS_13340 [Promethearchaeota archaeon]